MTEHDHTASHTEPQPETEIDEQPQPPTPPNPVDYTAIMSNGESYAMPDIIGWNVYQGFAQFFDANNMLVRAIRADLLESFAPDESDDEVYEPDEPNVVPAAVDDDDEDGDGVPDLVDDSTDDDAYDEEADEDSKTTQP